jgi:hypothetical protein
MYERLHAGVCSCFRTVIGDAEMVWLIHWLLVQIVFRGIAWVMGAIFVLVSPWLAQAGAFLSPWFAWFHPIWTEVIALGSDYRVWGAVIVAAVVGDAVIAFAKKRAARKAAAPLPFAPHPGPSRARRPNLRLPTWRTFRGASLTWGCFFLALGFLGWLSDVIGILWVWGGLMVAVLLFTRWEMKRADRRSEERRLRAAMDAQAEEAAS